MENRTTLEWKTFRVLDWSRPLRNGGVIILGINEWQVSQEGGVKLVRRDHFGEIKSEKMINLHWKGNKVKFLGIPTGQYVHRLVADAWIPNPQGLKRVKHINGNREDNRLENLIRVGNYNPAKLW
jgi:hypothetical protein